MTKEGQVGIPSKKLYCPSAPVDGKDHVAHSLKLKELITLKLD
jgi:hypothetical protein